MDLDPVFNWIALSLGPQGIYPAFFGPVGVILAQTAGAPSLKKNKKKNKKFQIDRNIQQN